MKAIKLFSMAVAALILGACSNEDNDIQQPAQQARMIPFEATIGPAASANTRTVVKEGTGDYAGKLTVAWKGNEEIALVHNGICDKVTVTKVNEDGSAVVSGSIKELGTEGEDAKLVYPYGAVASVSSGTTYTPNTSAEFLAPGYAQDGTLDYIGTNDLDGRVGTGILKTVGGVITIKKSATEDNVVMESKTAIWKLTLQDNESTPNAINAKTVTLKLGGTTIAGGSYASGKSSYYICVVPATLTQIYGLATAMSLPTPAFTIEASDGTNTYTYTKTSQLTLANGTYYQSTVTMTKQSSSLLSVIVYDGYNTYGNKILYYTTTDETWGDAIKNHPTENAGWDVDSNNRIYHSNSSGSAYAFVTSDFVKSGTVIDATDTYFFGEFVNYD